jgi:hypothetical protein
MLYSPFLIRTRVRVVVGRRIVAQKLVAPPMGCAMLTSSPMAVMADEFKQGGRSQEAQNILLHF